MLSCYKDQTRASLFLEILPLPEHLNRRPLALRAHQASKEALPPAHPVPLTLPPPPEPPPYQLRKRKKVTVDSGPPAELTRHTPATGCWEPARKSTGDVDSLSCP